MIQLLPPQARTEHVAILMIIMYHPAHATNAKALMETAKIRSKNTFARVTKELQNWGFIGKEGRYGKYHIDTSKYHIDTSQNQNNDGKYHIDTSQHNHDNHGKYHIDTSKYHIDTSPNKDNGHCENVDNSETTTKPATYDQKKSLLKQNSRVHAHTHERTEGGVYILSSSQKEKKGFGEKRKKTFLESELADYQKFLQLFAKEPAYKNVNLAHYFGYLKTWTDEDGNPVLSSNWASTAKTLIRNDYHRNKLKTL